MGAFASKQSPVTQFASAEIMRSFSVKSQPEVRGAFSSGKSHPADNYQPGAANPPGYETVSDWSEQQVHQETRQRAGWNFTQIPVHTLAVPALQTKLTINKPGDEYEQEADRVAEHVMRMPIHANSRPMPARAERGVQRKCACGGSCDECKKEDSSTDHTKVQRKTSGASDAGLGTVPSAVHQVLQSPGQPLGGEIRSFLEPRFGHDFSRVRVHTEAAAAQSARAVGALAYTVGSHISFAEGSFAPSTDSGRRLLAHELTHTIQQGEASPAMAPQRTAPVRRSVLQREPNKYAKLTIEQLRKLVSNGDKEAVEALYQRYEAMSNGQLARYARGKDQIAQSVYAKRVVPPTDAVGQGRFSKGGMQDTLAKDIKADRSATSVNRRAPSAVEPNLEVQGGTVGAARTDIPGLEGRSFVGRSPQAGGQVNANSNFPPATDVQTLPHTHGHAEQNIADQLEEALAKIPREQLKGRKVWMLIEQEPCSTCAQGAVNTETAAGVLKKLSLKYPEITFEIKSLESSGLIVLKGAESASAGAAGAASNAGGGQQATSVQVETKIEVISSVRNADGTTVSEVEYNFGRSLDKINSTAPAGTTVPNRIVMRVTQNADGSLASIESLSGQPQAMVEALAQKTLTAGAGEAAAIGEGTAVAAANTGRRMALLFKGLKIGGTAAFVVITAYQLFTATPKERPRVLAGAAGGLAGGALSTYLICNALLDIETAGWGLLICGVFAGGAGAYGGTKGAEAAYDAATATDLDKAYNTLSRKSRNEIGIFNFLLGKMGSDGCVDAPFVRGFMDVFPSLANDSETVLIAAQLADAAIQPVPPAKTLPTRSFPKPSGPGGDTVCPGCHGRSTRDLVPPTMTPSDLEALKALPTCSTVTGQALNALRFAVKNLPPRPRSEMMHEPFNPPKRTPGPNEHSTPPGVTFSDPIPRTFPTEREQLGTKCPNCHAPNEGKEVWKVLGPGFGEGMDGKMTDAKRKWLQEWAAPAQQR